MKIENACFCENAIEPCPWWVAENARFKLKNLVFLAQAIQFAIRVRVVDMQVSVAAEARMERVRLSELAGNMKAYNVESLTYAPCCDVKPIEKMLVDKLSELAEKSKDEKWVEQQKFHAALEAKLDKEALPTENLSMEFKAKEHIAALQRQRMAHLAAEAATVKFQSKGEFDPDLYQDEQLAWSAELDRGGDVWRATEIRQ